LEDASVAFGKEQGQAAAVSGKDIVVGAVKTPNEAFASESAEVIGHLAGAVMGLAEMGGYQGTKGGVGEAIGQVAELAQAGKQGHDTRVTEAETGSALAVAGGRQHDLLKGVGADRAVLTHALGIQKTPVSLSADGAQVG
jgi:hypothetical protein